MSADTDIFNKIKVFYDEAQGSTNHRYRSWEHCYNYFEAPEDHNVACLHLGFYLASWGMLRASSKLLQNDYLIHEGVVEKVLQPKYKHLRGLSFDSFLF